MGRFLLRWLWRLVLVVLVLVVASQLWFFAWVQWYAHYPPGTTAFMRRELSRLRDDKPDARLQYQWVPYARISGHLKRAVVAAEDDEFASHEGVNWDAIERAWEYNRKLKEAQAKAAARGKTLRAKPMRGGSTITQQLAKNLFLSPERSYVRKGQELVIAYMLENAMEKERILELYLNVVEWGNGIFGAEAAARHYFGVSAAQLSSEQAARLAAMLPRPKFFDKNRGSAFLARHSASIQRRMHGIELP
jgi:monofunctional biosynthetic peptidoglycan transglycosylase